MKHQIKNLFNDHFPIIVLLVIVLGVLFLTTLATWAIHIGIELGSLL